MKRILALSLSLFVLANTITVSQTQALPKPVKVAGKLACGLGFGGFAVFSGIFALASWQALLQKTNNVNDLTAKIFFAGPLAITATGLALTSGAVSLYSFKSAENDIKN